MNSLIKIGFLLQQAKKDLSSVEVERLLNFVSKLNIAQQMRIKYVLESQPKLVDEVIYFIKMFLELKTPNEIEEKLNKALLILEESNNSKQQNNQQQQKQQEDKEVTENKLAHIRDKIQKLFEK